MCLRLELPSLLSCGNLASVYAWEPARCFRNFPICAQCDFYKSIKLILGKSALENSEPWDLKEPMKADKNGETMTKPSWLKWLYGGCCFSAHPPAHPWFLPLPLPLRFCCGWAGLHLYCLWSRGHCHFFLAVAGWDLRLGPRYMGLTFQPGKQVGQSCCDLRELVVKLWWDPSRAVPAGGNEGI